MAEGKVSGCWNLRMKCFVFGYTNLVACIVDILFHVLIAAIVSNGFQCDVDRKSLTAVNWPWLEPLLLFLNLGTHGFYAFPMTLRSNGHYADHMPLPQYAKCYPGMVHVYLIDILILLINIVWLKFVLAFISALHKRDPEPIRLFFQVWLVKLILQILYFAYEPTIQNTFPADTFWLMKLMDISISTAFLFMINSYINVLRKEKATSDAELPPPYVDYLIASKKSQDPLEEKKETLEDVAVVCDKYDKPAEIKHEVYQ